MNAGNENDEYVGFFKALFLSRLKCILQMEMKFTDSNSIYNDSIFLNGTKTIPCVVHV